MPKQASGGRPERTRIFIISEHAIYREALRRLLEVEPDFAVVGTAADCVNAVESVNDCAPDVVLIDLSAPLLPDGDALQRVSRASITARIILLAPAIPRSVITEALRKGVRGIVPKAGPAELLFMSIRTVLSGQYWIERDMVTDLVEMLCAPLLAPPVTATDQRFGLTRRELEIVSLLISGHANKQIADKCAISQRTVKHHLTNIFGKLGCSSRLEVVLFAMHHQLVPMEPSGSSSALSV